MFCFVGGEKLWSKWIHYDATKKDNESILPSDDVVNDDDKKTEIESCEHVNFFHKLDEGLKNQLVTGMLLESSNTAFDKIKNDTVQLFKLHPK